MEGGEWGDEVECSHGDGDCPWASSVALEEGRSGLVRISYDAHIMESRGRRAMLEWRMILVTYPDDEMRKSRPYWK